MRGVTMSYLFCNVGWMTDYKGQNENDKIVGGGSYVEREETGHEVCNFVPYENQMYGYVGLPKKRKIDINKLGTDSTHDFVENVNVIWTAHRKKKGRYVIGWYKNATVYREYQKFGKAVPPCHKANEIDGYRIVAEKSNCTLLPVEQRTIEVPRGVRGGMGQANIWYADKPESREIRNAILSQLSGLCAVYPDEIDPQETFVEGARKKVTVNAYERNLQARQKCLDAHGYKCSACEMSFEEYYGDLGRGFIHVHHIRELSRLSGEYKVDPVKDLCPVCPNCHAMIHRKKPALSVDELRQHLTNTRRTTQ